jgi:hypothetical protein
MNSADRRALSVCCKVDRDAVIEEQRAAIHRQQAEIVRLLAENAALRLGDGLIAPVLGRISPRAPGLVRTGDLTVFDYLAMLRGMSHDLSNVLLFGSSP